MIVSDFAIIGISWMHNRMSDEGRNLSPAASRMAHLGSDRSIIAVAGLARLDDFARCTNVAYYFANIQHRDRLAFCKRM
jgi:hypothetical protein